MNEINKTIKHPTWPAGETTSCACPHCGHLDEVRISNARDWQLEFRDGNCSACDANYFVVPVGGDVAPEKLPCNALNFFIRHYYDAGDLGISVAAPDDLDVRRAAIYIELMAEKWFGDDTCVTNLGIAAALVSFYGCKQAPRNDHGQVIDMHHDREEMCGQDLIAASDLYRDGLREFLSAHVVEL